MSFKRIIIVAVALLCYVSLHADTDIVRVRKAEGRWEVSGNVSADEAEEKALMEAKKEALRKAGIRENVWSVMGHISSTEGERFSEAYSSVSTLALNGMVNILDKKVEDVWDAKMKRLFKVVIIDAEVTRNEIKEDETFKVDVKGIEPVYKNGDIFRCSFKVYGCDSYVKVFWFTNDEAAMIYPNDYEGNQKFLAEETYTIPVTDDIEMVMEKGKPDLEVEFINVIVLATKKDYPYLGKSDFQSILSWIYKIPADQRTLHHATTVIK